MAQFEELQQLWQRHAQSAMPPHDAAELSHAFRRYGRRHDLIYIVKTALIACQFIFLVTLLHDRPLALFWACVTDLSGVFFLVSDWRTQRAIARLNFAAPSMEFVRTAIARLQAQRDLFRTREFWIAMAGIWMGCNLMVANMQPNMTLRSALPAHAVANVTMFAAFFLGRWIRRKRFEKECRPLIARLQAVLVTMEADRV
jgi:hypothetical protein